MGFRFCFFVSIVTSSSLASCTLPCVLRVLHAAGRWPSQQLLLFLLSCVVYLVSSKEFVCVAGRSFPCLLLLSTPSHLGPQIYPVVAALAKAHMDGLIRLAGVRMSSLEKIKVTFANVATASRRHCA